MGLPESLHADKISEPIRQIKRAGDLKSMKCILIRITYNEDFLTNKFFYIYANASYFTTDY